MRLRSLSVAVSPSLDRGTLAVVTGASSGIGTEFARLLAQRGHPVAIVGRDAARLSALAAELTVPTHVLQVDLTDSDGLRKAEAFVQNPPLPIGILVNNAGAGWWGPFVQQRRELIDATVELNVTALIRLTRVALPAMIAAGNGGVLNVSSAASTGAKPEMALYAATKAFVDSFSASLREELADSGVRVICARPSWVRTDFHVRSTQNVSNVTDWLTPHEVALHALEAFDRNEATLEMHVRRKGAHLTRARRQLRALVVAITPQQARRAWRKMRARRAR